MILENILLLKINFIENFGYFLVIMAAFLEVSPLVGIFIPGSLVVFFAGFFAKLGILNFKIVIVLAIIGAILGDLGGYLFGRCAGKKFLHKFGKSFLIRREYIEIGADICRVHTGKALVFGRLNPVTRSVAPFIVGTHKVNFWRFAIFNIIGGVLWGILFSSLGYAFGHEFRYAVDIEKWIVKVTLALVLLFYLIYFMRILIKRFRGDKYTDLDKLGKECKIRR